ncbi:MAG: hypothetical protein WD232_05905 [Acidimicrobiales bacterium]
MIAGWFKALLLAGLLLFAAVDLGAPLVVRVQLDKTAGDAAAAGGRTYLRAHSMEQAEAAARIEAEADGASLERFQLQSDGRISLTVVKQARSSLFDRIEQLSTWYEVRVHATSTGSAL